MLDHDEALRRRPRRPTRGRPGSRPAGDLRRDLRKRLRTRSSARALLPRSHASSQPPKACPPSPSPSRGRGRQRERSQPAPAACTDEKTRQLYLGKCCSASIARTAGGTRTRRCSSQLRAFAARRSSPPAKENVVRHLDFDPPSVDFCTPHRLKVGRRSCQGQSEVGVKVGQRSVSRSVGGMCQGRSDVGVKVGREYVSKLVGGRVKVSVGRSSVSHGRRVRGRSHTCCSGL